MIPRFYPIYQVAWETEIHPTEDHCVTYIYLPSIIMPKVAWTKMEWKPYEVKKLNGNVRTYVHMCVTRVIIQPDRLTEDWKA